MYSRSPRTLMMWSSQSAGRSSRWPGWGTRPACSILLAENRAHAARPRFALWRRNAQRNRSDLSVRENLDLGDARVWANEESRVKLVRVLRRLRPRVVFTQFWEDPHPDHAHTSQLVREACHVSGLAKYDQEGGQERWRPSCVAYFLFPRTIPPSFIVDISESSDRKWEAIRAHTSQFFNPQSTEAESRVSAQAFLSEVESRDRYFGALIGVERGEAFFVREALNVEDPIALLTRRMNMYS